jgi:hypothetical protein
LVFLFCITDCGYKKETTLKKKKKKKKEKRRGERARVPPPKMKSLDSELQLQPS